MDLRIKKILKFIEENLDKDLTLKKLAKYVNLSYHYLCKEQFMSDNKTQDAVMRRLEIIGEAVKNIPEYFRKKYPEISWKQIAGMRDVLIHGYFDINLQRVWLVLEKELPTFKNKII